MPRIKVKHLNREQLEFLLDHMMETLPDHEITEWLKRGFCMNEGDSTISFSSLEGYKMLQWGINHFDEEDKENYDLWYGEGNDDIDWDEDW